MSVFDAARSLLDPNPGIDASSQELWNVLGNQRRRDTIEALARREQGSTIALGTLADHVAEAEHGPDYTATHRKNVYVALTQSHLEKLEAVNAARVEQTTITVGPAARPLADLIQHAEREVFRG